MQHLISFQILASWSRDMCFFPWLIIDSHASVLCSLMLPGLLRFSPKKVPFSPSGCESMHRIASTYCVSTTLLHELTLSYAATLRGQEIYIQDDTLDKNSDKYERNDDYLILFIDIFWLNIICKWRFGYCQAASVSMAVETREQTENEVSGLVVPRCEHETRVLNSADIVRRWSSPCQF